MFSLSGWSTVVLVSAALAACGQAATVTSSPASTPAASAAPAERPCAVEQRLAARYLPQGWTAAWQRGPGGGGMDPAAVGHWSGGPGRYVQVTRGRMSELVEPQQPLTVLGQDARGGAIHDGFAVDFRLCDADYQLQGYGIAAGDLYQVAESLSPAE